MPASEYQTRQETCAWAATRKPKDLNPGRESKSQAPTKGSRQRHHFRIGRIRVDYHRVPLNNMFACTHKTLPANLRRLISSQRKHKIGPRPLPNSCYLRCDRCLPDAPPPPAPLARTHSPGRVPTSHDSRLCNCFLIRRRTGHESASGNSGKAYKRKVAGVDKVDTVGGVRLDHGRMEGTGRQRQSSVCDSQRGEFRCARSVCEELRFVPINRR